MIEIIGKIEEILSQGTFCKRRQTIRIQLAKIKIEIARNSKFKVQLRANCINLRPMIKVRKHVNLGLPLKFVWGKIENNRKF